tara:strand:+ start:1384 stop:1572 length:189 start_codon:yes stop_codon:yes gene_type:complete
MKNLKDKIMGQLENPIFNAIYTQLNDRSFREIERLLWRPIDDQVLEQILWQIVDQTNQQIRK